MARDVNGDYTSPTNDSSPAAPRNVIRSSDFNEIISDLATALTDSWSRSGKGAALADLDMNGFDLLNAPNLATAAQGVLADGAAQKAQNLADLADKAAGRFNLKIPVYVADRTALKALDTTKDILSYLKEDGREGIFEWSPGDFSAQITSDTQEGVYIKAGAVASSSGAWVRRYSGGVNAKWFGAGSGLSRSANTTALQAMFDFCALTGQKWIIPAGDFQTNPVTAYTGGEFTGRLLGENNPANEHIFKVSPLPADVVTLNAAAVNALTITRGLDKDAGLASYFGHCVWLRNYGDEVPIIRTSGTVRWLEAVVVHDPDGSFYPPYSQTKTATWTDPFTVSGATRMRDVVIIKSPKVVVENTGAGALQSIMRCDRPNTIFDGGYAKSESTLEVLQACLTEKAAHVSYRGTRVEGLRENNTNYGWNYDATCNTDLDDCSEIYCRRGQDGHGAKHVTIHGGSLPDGIGGHWIHGLYVSGGAYITSDNPNTAPIFAAGSDVSVEGCRIALRPEQFDVFGVRGDLFELRGMARIVDCQIEVDCTANLTTQRRILNMNTTAGAHDWGRTINMPSHIQITGNLIRQLGASFNEQLSIVNLLSSIPTPPSGIVAGGAIDVSGNTISFAAGDLFGTTPRAVIGLFKGNGWTSGGYAVNVEDLSGVQIFAFCSATHPTPSTPRNDFNVKKIGKLQWQANYGNFRYAQLEADAMQLNLKAGRPGTGLATPVGDERETFTGNLYGEVVWNPPNIADAAMASTTMTVSGVKLGDGAVVSISTMTEAGWLIFAQGTADNTLTITAFNKTGGALDKGSSLVRAWAHRWGSA